MRPSRPGRWRRDRGLPIEVVIGEEVSTRGGHLLALFVETPIPPYRSLCDTIAAVHDAGGLAIPAHPLVPYPLCAQGWVLRRLIDDADERVHPDAIETFNPTALGRPWHAGVVRFADRHGLAHVGNSDAHALAAIGTGWTSFPGRTRGRPAPGDRGPRHGAPRGVPRDLGPAWRVRAAALQARARRPRRAHRPVASRRDRPGPRLSRRPAAAARYDPRRAGPGRGKAPAS